MQKRIELRSYAKINLCLDVGGVMEGGYHEVNMIMQQILLCDDVAIQWMPGEECEIQVGTNRRYLPNDRRNLAWQAAELMATKFGERIGTGRIRIDIKKRIPVAAGLAGGSSNCASVLHGINQLWNLGLSLQELCDLGAQLGSDVPFCIMGQAAADAALKPAFGRDPLAAHCAVATGRGTELRPIKGLRAHLVLSKPPISVSTAEAYRGVDEAVIPARPDVEEMAAALARWDMGTVEKNMINVLENFTLKRYPIVVYTKDKMQELCKNGRVLMSGSGPTVFGLCGSREEAKRICGQMREVNRESFWTRTTW